MSVANSTAIAYTAVIANPTVTAAAVVPTATVVATPSPITVVPGAGADEQTANEPAGTVISVRRACVGRIVVIAPLANWRRIVIPVIAIPVAIADANPYTYLSVSRSRKKRCGNHHGAEQQEIS
jgi:hypothetical protein